MSECSCTSAVESSKHCLLHGNGIPKYKALGIDMKNELNEFMDGIRDIARGIVFTEAYGETKIDNSGIIELAEYAESQYKRGKVEMRDLCIEIAEIHDKYHAGLNMAQDIRNIEI